MNTYRIITSQPGTGEWETICNGTNFALMIEVMACMQGEKIGGHNYFGYNSTWDLFLEEIEDLGRGNIPYVHYRYMIDYIDQGKVKRFNERTGDWDSEY